MRSFSSSGSRASLTKSSCSSSKADGRSAGSCGKPNAIKHQRKGKDACKEPVAVSFIHRDMIKERLPGPGN